MAILDSELQLDNFWETLENEFFQKVDSQLHRFSLNVDENESEIHELKQKIGERMMKQSAVATDLFFDEAGVLDSLRVEKIFFARERYYKEEVEKFVAKKILNWN
ncbi:hypothetical protein [Enterococcus sp. LJL51]|uniref:hypothetical protein n=1 Tax=Enterococcus sp. LJL51 TaxID=3416656 RepID=UPI003CE9CCA7